MILTAICTLLIKETVWKAVISVVWKAVEAELKIAQHEYYMASVVQRIFTKRFRDRYICILYGNSLDYHKCAFYIQTWSYEDESSDLRSLETRWKRLHGISLTGEMLTNSFVSFINGLCRGIYESWKGKALYDVCHAYRITTKVPNMKFIHVIADGTITQKSPYTENGKRIILVCSSIGLCGSQKTEGIIQILSIWVRDFLWASLYGYVQEIY